MLFLSRADIAALMRLEDYLSAVEAGFRASAAGAAASPAPMHIGFEHGGFHAKGAWIAHEGRRYAAVKLNGNFPENPARHGLPTIQGAIFLADAENGTPLAVMDSIEVTIRRTAAASALAARYLARPDSSSIAVCGCGEQGRAHVEALKHVLPLNRAVFWDQDDARARALAAETRSLLGETSVASSVQDAVRGADVIATCTTAQASFLMREHVAAGAFIAAVGADAPHKSEISPDLSASASFFADVLEQCLAMGDLRHAVAAGRMQASDVRADLAQLVMEAHPGRSDRDEITMFDSTGTALEDAASAVIIYQRALAGGGGTRLTL